MHEILPTPKRAANAIAAAQKFWRLWDGRLKRAEMDGDPKGALPGITRRRLACQRTMDHWHWVAAELKAQTFSPTRFRQRTKALHTEKTNLELQALRFQRNMKAESYRAGWHGISEQE